MIRPFAVSDRSVLLKMMNNFYHSSAVNHVVPESYFNATINTILSNSPYTEGWIIEYDSIPAGYGLVSKSYSNEAGGLVIWLEELYIDEKFRGQGLGSSLIAYIEDQYRDQASRFRLEVTDSNVSAERLYRKIGYKVLPYKQMIKNI